MVFILLLDICYQMWAWGIATDLCVDTIFYRCLLWYAVQVCTKILVGLVLSIYLF